MNPRRLAVCAALSLFAASELRAQCTDGTPPPCASARVAAAPRRADPPLDDRTWLVVPFNNVTRAQEADWLRDASVNLLYLDLSKWRDIHVIDDARVADLARQVSEARTMPLSLDAATTMARRAGAGRLVMGNVIKQGTRTTLAAKVFDVRRGTLLRSPQQDLVAQDSLMPVFGRLARGILDIAPPPGTDIAGIGTLRVDAYQEYLIGTQALNRFDLAPARTHLEQALKLDPSFALAHYKLAIEIGWQNVNDTAKVSHAAAAARLSGSLPVRERALMRGLDAFEHLQYDVACQTYGGLVKADSSDVEALYGVGECNYHDANVEPLASDTTKRAFRGSYNAAIRVFERALVVDPTYHLAFQHILDALTTSSRSGYDRSRCPAPAPTGAACLYRAFVRRDHDTLVTVPVFVRDTIGYAVQAADYIRSDARRRNLEKARDKAKAWEEEAPDENRAHVALGHVETLLGDAVEARAAFSRIKGRLDDVDASKVVPDRVELAVKAGQGDVARRIVDSARMLVPGDMGPITMGLMFGHSAPFDSVLNSNYRRQGASMSILAPYYVGTFHSIVAGAIPSVESAERAYVEIVSKTPQWDPARAAAQMPTYFFALGLSRTWPHFEYPLNDHRAAAIVALARGDTARLRSEARVIDSALVTARSAVPDSGTGLFTAQIFLALHDSAAALHVVRRMLDTSFARSSLGTPVFGVGSVPVLLTWPRLALMRADLEAAVGDKRVAHEWYRRFLDLWGDADAEFAPIVARARRGYAATGGG